MEDVSFKKHFSLTRFNIKYSLCMYIKIYVHIDTYFYKIALLSLKLKINQRKRAFLYGYNATILQLSKNKSVKDN